MSVPEGKIHCLHCKGPAHLLEDEKGRVVYLFHPNRLQRVEERRRIRALVRGGRR